MVDAATISGAVSSLQAASEIAKSIIGIRDGAIIQTKAIELQSIILSAQSSALSAQSEQFILQNRVRDLEKEMANIKAWEREKKKYQLIQVSNGAFAYTCKELEGSEPPHNICAQCYENGHKSILQLEIRIPGMDRVLVCHRCTSDIYETGAWRSEHSARKTGKR